ncbi:MAG: aspartyl/asparaginyl beta-hydroxylase domain-containing protein [Terricaulis sp.]
MKLNTRFLQLPVQFDAQILAREIASLEVSAWRPHPAGYAGNDYLPLIAAYGDPGNESFSGPMLPTPHLSAQRPYLWESLASLGAVLGRTRLMRLSGHAEVSEHADVNYYWRDRMRVHVPIVTQPVVSFHCADITVHMAAGECWVFDTWSLHRVINDQTQSRIHLVADTVGGEGMLRLLAGGRAPNASAPQDWMVRKVEPTGERPALQFETTNVPKVMSPWEIREHLNFLLSEVGPNQPTAKEVARIAGLFLHKWRALWAAYGEAETGWPRYRALVAQFTSELKVARADSLLLVNEVDFFESLSAMVLAFAVSAEQAATLPVHTQGAP